MIDDILQIIQHSPVPVAIEIAVIWFVIYVVYRFLRGTRGAGALKGLAVLVAIAALVMSILGRATTDTFVRLDYLYNWLFEILAILFIVVFQPELRQAMIRVGQAWTFGAPSASVDTSISEIGDAVDFLGRSKFGALIAIERGSRLGGLIESGIRIDSVISAPLLGTIFWPNTPLHDLGVVVRGDRIVAANVQFPLAEEGALGSEYGSRHRAAAGLSLETDALVVIVSEETGGISVADRGRIEKMRDRAELVRTLIARLRLDVNPDPPAADAVATTADSGRRDSTGDGA